MTPPPAALRLRLSGCALIMVLGLVLWGCGDGGAATAGDSSAQQSEPRTTTPRTTTSRCPRQLQSFVQSLDVLRRQLAVGLAYEQYVAKVKALRSAYDEIPIGHLTIDCLATAGTPGEQALNKHIEAANAWGECLANASCTTASIEPVLQRKWRIASRFLSEAK